MRNWILLTSLFFAFNLNAQDFAQVDSEWHYSYWNNGYVGCVELLYEKDTIVGGLECKEFYRHTDILNTWFDTVYLWKDNPHYIRVEDDQVFVWIDRFEKFEMLYDFSAEKGDSWVIEMPRDLDFTRYLICNVLENGTEIINGETLRWYEVEYEVQGSAFYKFKDRIYEKIGPEKTALFPWDPMWGETDGNNFGSLVRYMEQDFTFESQNSQNCESVSSISKVPVHELILYPNPVMETIMIETDIRIEKVVVHDQNGRPILSSKDIQKIDVSELDSGVYFLQLHNKDYALTIWRHFVKQ